MKNIDDLPEIQHPTVKMGAELDIYYPNWSTALTLPNNVNQEEIIKLGSEYVDSL